MFTPQYTLTRVAKLLVISLALQLIPACTGCHNPTANDSHSQSGQPNTPPMPPLSLALQDIQRDPTTGQVTCQVTQQGKKAATGVVIYWESLTPTSQITQIPGGESIQELAIAKLGTAADTYNIGYLSFGDTPLAKFRFWMTCVENTSKFSEQVIEFHDAPVKLTLTPVGPTRLVGPIQPTTNANKVFTVKVEQENSEAIHADKVKLEIKRAVSTSSVQVLYNNKPIPPLTGNIDLEGKTVGEFELVINPGTETYFIFYVRLLYDGQEQGKVRFSWYQQEATDAFEAINKADFEAFKEIIKNNPKTINRPSQTTKGARGGDTLLTRVIRSGPKDMKKQYVEVLLRNSANLNIRNNSSQRTPLYYAIMDENTDIVTLLLENKNISLSATISDYEGYSPFHAAAAKGNTAIMRQLLDKLKQQLKDQGKDEEKIKREMASYLNTQTAPPNNQTPFMLVPISGSGQFINEMVKLLEEYGLSLDTTQPSQWIVKLLTPPAPKQNT